MVAIQNLLLVATVAVASVLPRDDTQILKDLGTINTDTQKLTTTITSWKGDLFGALPIQGQASQVGTDTDNAAKNAKGKTYTSSETLDIGNYIISDLEPSINGSLNALVAAKPKFDKIFLTGLVKSTLGDLQKKANNLSTVLVADANPDLKTAAQQIADVIANDFAIAVKAFNK